MKTQVKNAGERAPKLLDQVRNLMRLQHYSIHTERSYVDWIRRFVRFHRMETRADLENGEAKIEAFLTDLAVRGNVSASTQNQAMKALVFLYRRVLKQTLDEKIDAVWAEPKINVPVVMAREEVHTVISLLGGVPQLIVKMLYGSGFKNSSGIKHGVHVLAGFGDAKI
jgi:site-specific recombinase XerD